MKKLREENEDDGTYEKDDIAYWRSQFARLWAAINDDHPDWLRQYLEEGRDKIPLSENTP